jgi:dihydrofolate reductase
MNAIVAVCEDWGIGHEGRLLVRNKADMKSFVAHTTGGTVIMGRTTLEGFPGARPLKNRRNIVLSGNPAYRVEGAEVVHSIEEALEAVAGEDPERVWVIGGERVYSELLPYCSRAFVTRNGCTMPADAFFPDLDASEGWELERSDGSGETEAGIPYEFLVYRHVGQTY